MKFPLWVPDISSWLLLSVRLHFSHLVFLALITYCIGAALQCQQLSSASILRFDILCFACPSPIFPENSTLSSFSGSTWRTFFPSIMGNSAYFIRIRLKIPSFVRHIRCFTHRYCEKNRKSSPHRPKKWSMWRIRAASPQPNLPRYRCYRHTRSRISASISSRSASWYPAFFSF